MIDDPVGREALETAGAAAFAGFRLQTMELTTSTQDVVRAAARAGAPAGFCCLAAAQSAGRGRQDRTWSAPPGTAMLASLLVRADPRTLGLLPLAAGLAVRAAIEITTGAGCVVKWPNDLLARERKLAGLLCEVEPAAPGSGIAVVVGVGVNLRVRSFPQGVAGVSLHELCAAPPSPPSLLAATISELATRIQVLDSGGAEAIRREWLEHATLMGEPVSAVSPAGKISGTAVGIDRDGALLLRTAQGRVRVLAGDVHLERS